VGVGEAWIASRYQGELEWYCILEPGCLHDLFKESMCVYWCSPDSSTKVFWRPGCMYNIKITQLSRTKLALFSTCFSKTFRVVVSV
jgi:hypothetical protein